MRDLTQHLTTRADDSHAAPVFGLPERHYQISKVFPRCQIQVRFFALRRIKPHAPPLVRAPVNSFEFLILRSYSPGGSLNAFAPAQQGSIPATPSDQRLLRGLPGYLILFATHAFAPQRQYWSRKSPSPPVFLQIYRISPLHLEFHFPLPYSSIMVSNALSELSPELSHLTSIQPARPLRPIIPNNARTPRITAAAGTELAGASFMGTVNTTHY